MDPFRGLVLGAGNPMQGDEAFGMGCVEALLRRYDCPPQLTVTDVGTQGLYLVDLLRRNDAVVIFDAVDFGAEPGSLFRVYDDDIRGFLSRHHETQMQACLRESIACAHLLGGCARWMLLVAVQPVSLEPENRPLHDRLRLQIPEALVIAVEYLDFCGVAPRPRSPRPIALPQAAPKVTVYPDSHKAPLLVAPRLGGRQPR